MRQRSAYHQRAGRKGVPYTDADGRKDELQSGKILGLDKGSLAEGKIADVVIIDPNEEYVIDKNTFASKGRNTPFHGRTVRGKVKVTICDGKVVYKDK